MSDWQANAFLGHSGVISTAGLESQYGQALRMSSGTFNAAGTWPAANRALYFPVVVQQTVTVYQMSFIVGVQSGNYDIGIYDEARARLVSVGSTAVPAAGFAPVDITNTTLTPGVYYLAMVCSTASTLTIQRNASLIAEVYRTSGVAQENLGATTLPATATFATYAQAYAPLVSAHLVATT